MSLKVSIYVCYPHISVAAFGPEDNTVFPLTILFVFVIPREKPKLISCKYRPCLLKHS